MTGKVLMVQGTNSAAGKSLLVTALCRIFRQDGWRVAPFKAQNMSLNSFVTAQGLEMGRAQVVQAEAAGVPPHIDMNPVLIKPEGANRSQIVLMGKPWNSLSETDYYQRKQILWSNVTAALNRLREQYELVIIEGAGSPAEINLRESDIVNMAVALFADAPVLLVGDIDRGGVFASLVGTLVLLDEREREMVKGFVINKFRGDERLLQGGLEMLQARANVPVMGVIHYLHNLEIAEEDSVALDEKKIYSESPNSVDIAIIKFPRISNFDDFDSLELETGVRVRFINRLGELGRPDAVILPGTKHTLSDLDWLCSEGLDRRIIDLAHQGTAVVGICGGYQMLGVTIADPIGVESSGPTQRPGLGLLPIATIFEPSKTTLQAQAIVQPNTIYSQKLSGKVISGYEIHMGQSVPLDSTARPLFYLQEQDRTDGTIDPSGRILGTYLHGLFDNSHYRRTWLQSLGWIRPEQPVEMDLIREAAYDRVAAAVRSSLDMDRINAIVGFA